MISLKKDYERNVKLINVQMLLCQHNKPVAVQMHFPTTSDYCQGLPSFCNFLYKFTFFDILAHLPC